MPDLSQSCGVHNLCGVRPQDLRSQVADLFGAEYPSNQMSYDLRRLQRKGILWRVPHSYRYLITPYELKVALFFTRLHARVFRPGFAAMDPSLPIPSPLAKALANVEHEIDDLIHAADLTSQT